MTAPASLRKGQIVRYHGSQRSCQGMVLRVNRRYDCDGGIVRYDLSEWAFTLPFSTADEIVLMNVRPESVTHIPAADIKSATCPECAWEYWYLRGAEGCCPACAQVAEARRMACA